MILYKKCDPHNNVLYLGYVILKYLKNGKSINAIITYVKEKTGVSENHVILSLDFLYSIAAIELKNSKIVKTNDAR